MTELSDTVRLSAGDTAPAFTATAHTGNHISLSDFAGQKVIVYFYPRANTPGCTTEACDFQDSLAQLNGHNVTVLGISPDSPEKLQNFADKYSLTFPLLSDPEHHIMNMYGAFGEKKNYGKIVQGVIRSTFVIDESGTIELAKYNVRATGHVARIIKELEL